MFHCSQPRSSSDCQPPEISIQTTSSVTSEADVQLSPLAADKQEVPFTDVHTQLAPTTQQEKEDKEDEEEVAKEREEDKNEEAEEREIIEERVSEEYALSSTLRVEEKEEEQQADES